MASNDYRVKNVYLPEFDGIRGLFCFSILIIHHHFIYINLPSNFGYWTMHCFFIMSAFLITRMLMIDKKRAQGNFKTFFITFYIKRTLRIFPVYFFYLAFTLVVGLMVSKTVYKPVLGIFYEWKYFGWMMLTFTYNFKDLYAHFAGYTYNKALAFPHLWSLSLEEQFYIIVPFMIWFLKEETLKRLTIAMMIIFPIIRIIGFNWLLTLPMDNMQRDFIFYRCTIFQYDAFFYGTFLALFDFTWKEKTIERIFYAIVTIYFLLIPINGIMLMIQECMNYFNQYGLMPFMGWMLHHPYFEHFSHITTSYEFMTRNGQYIYIDVIVNFIAILLFYICFKDKTSFPIFRQKLVVEMGSKLTYSSYVYQFLFIIPTLLFLFPFLQNKYGQIPAEIISMLLCISSLVVMSYFSYITMETYFLKKKDKYLAKYKKPKI